MQSYPTLITKNQPGQTLIETLIAIFILTSGITAAVGLAIYALASSSSITKQMVATGLAREGIEAIKYMRDTNWLKIGAPDTNCYDFPSGQNSAKCYKQWLNPAGGFNYNIQPASDYKEYRLIIDPSVDLFWDIRLESFPEGKFGLNFDSDINGVSFSGFYTTPSSAGVIHGTSDFYRKIILSTQSPNTDPPFDQPTLGPRLQVFSRVWWTDKKCPRSQEWPGLGKCSVELQTYLTNWKDY